jgi:hypothetical protein
MPGALSSRKFCQTVREDKTNCIVNLIKECINYTHTDTHTQFYIREEPTLPVDLRIAPFIGRENLYACQMSAIISLPTVETLKLQIKIPPFFRINVFYRSLICFRR